ncbi:MAG: hypothetical protein ACYCZ2_18345 [Lutibacter sp.]
MKNSETIRILLLVLVINISCYGYSQSDNFSDYPTDEIKYNIKKYHFRNQNNVREIPKEVEQILLDSIVLFPKHSYWEEEIKEKRETYKFFKEQSKDVLEWDSTKEIIKDIEDSLKLLNIKYDESLKEQKYYMIFTRLKIKGNEKYWEEGFILDEKYNVLRGAIFINIIFDSGSKYLN